MSFEFINYTKSFAEKYQAVIDNDFEKSKEVYISNTFNYLTLFKIKSKLETNFNLVTLDDNSFNAYVLKLETLLDKKENIAQFNNDNQDYLLNETQVEFYDMEIQNAPIVRIVDSIIIESINLHASDIHIEPSSEELIVRIRIDGNLIVHDKLPIISLNEISTRIKVLSNLDITKKRSTQDGKFKFDYKDKSYDIRVSILPTIYGEMIDLRILELDHVVLNIEDLKLPTKDELIIRKLISSSSGLILVCGPTGSGKSTTLQAFLKENLKQNVNIITVEDPVEYSIKGINHVQVNNEIGLDFANVLRNILRQDPNIIMIGEIRDVETAQICCRASITGHLVYSTLHTNTSIGAINRLIDMKVESYLLIDALKGIISQRLVRRLCPYCKEEASISENDAYTLGIDLHHKVYKPVGCKKCLNTGYKGRIGVFEVIDFDDEFKELLSKNSSSKKYETLLKKKRIISIKEQVIDLYRNGETSIEEVKLLIN